MKNIPKEVYKMLQLNNKFKKKFGEVFTPIPLVEEMLSKLPEEDWKNKDLKWLDPACGSGNFLLIIKEKLMDGLKDTISDEGEREKWILENMIYGVDLSLWNTELCALKLDPYSKYNLNVKAHDSLKFNFWKLKFERIIGNPPYQKEQKNEGKRGGGASLWDDFVKIAIDISKKGGYICFVHPSKWRKPISKIKLRNPANKLSNSLWDIMSSKNILYLSFHNTGDGNSTFKAGTRYDWYIMQNVPYNGFTTIKDEEGKLRTVNLNEIPFLPNCRFDEVFRLLAKGNEETCPIIFDRGAYGTDKCYKWTNEKETPIFRHPLIHATRKNEIRYYYSSQKNEEHFEVSKVIFGESGINSSSIIDMEGKYGMTQEAMAIQVNSLEEAENIKQALDSEEFNGLLKTACSWSNFRIDWRLFTHFRRDWWKEFIQ